MAKKTLRQEIAELQRVVEDLKMQVLSLGLRISRLELDRMAPAPYPYPTPKPLPNPPTNPPSLPKPWESPFWVHIHKPGDPMPMRDGGTGYSTDRVGNHL